MSLSVNIMLVVVIMTITILSITIVQYLRYIFYHHVYWSTRKVLWTPAQDNIPFEDLYIPISSSQHLHTWVFHFKTDPNATMLLYCHGSYGNITYYRQLVLFCQILGVDLCIFDYRGYGQSDGMHTRKHMLEDANAIYQYLLTHVNPSRLVVFGESLGSYSGSYLAMTYNLPIVILSGFSSLYDVVQYIRPFEFTTGIEFLFDTIFDRLATKHFLASTRSPVIIVHSTEDLIIPYSCAKINYAYAYTTNKTIIPLTGPHFNITFTLESLQALIQWVYPNGTTLVQQQDALILVQTQDWLPEVASHYHVGKHTNSIF